MAERNNTIIWIVILVALILGVLLIPVPKGSVSRTLLFSDYFPGTSINETKWNYDKANTLYNISDEGLNIYHRNGYNHGNDMSMKHSYNGNVLVFNADFNTKRGSEDRTRFFIRSTSTSLNNVTNLYNYILVSINGYSHGDFIVTYVTQELKYKYITSYAGWTNNTWYQITIAMDRGNNAFNVRIGQWDGKIVSWTGVDENGIAVGGVRKSYAKIYEESFSDWFTKDQPVYAGLHIGQAIVGGSNPNQVYSPVWNPPITTSVVFQLDNVELWSETGKTPSLNVFLLWLAIISLLLIIYGSVVNANCKQYHIIATCSGILGFSMIAGLLLNVWFFATWSLLTAMVAMWCMIVLIVHENWQIDYKYYEQVGTTATIIGITFTIITFIEYFTLILTNYYRPFWW